MSQNLFKVLQLGFCGRETFVFGFVSPNEIDQAYREPATFDVIFASNCFGGGSVPQLLVLRGVFFE